MLVANRFIRVIFRGAPGVSDSIILAKCSCSIRSLYKSMQHEMRKNFRTARGIRGFHAKHVTIHGNYNNARDKLVLMGRKEYRVIFYSSSQGMMMVSYSYLYPSCSAETFMKNY